VVRVAELAYLDLSESELVDLSRRRLTKFRIHRKVERIDTANVEPMAQVLTDDQTAEPPSATT